MKQTKGHQTENQRVQIKKWCKLARGSESKRCKTSGCETRAKVYREVCWTGSVNISTEM